MAPLARMIPSFGVQPLPNAAQSSSGQISGSQRPPHSSLGGKGVIGTGGKTGLGGKGLGKGGLKRHRYVRAILDNRATNPSLWVGRSRGTQFEESVRSSLPQTYPDSQSIMPSADDRPHGIAKGDVRYDNPVLPSSHILGEVSNAKRADRLAQAWKT